MNRRDVLAGMALCSLCCTADMAKALSFSVDSGSTLLNPCKARLPERLSEHELVRAAWDGLDASLVWDTHAHLLGDGKSGTGCWISPKMRSLFYPLPGVVPLFSVDQLVERGRLKMGDAAVIKEIREYNPVLFDFVLKRTLRVNGKKLSHNVFETARHFRFTRA